MSTFFYDIKFAIRQLLKNPTVTVVAVVSLTLGVTLNSTMFSLLDAIALRPLQVNEPDSLVRIFNSTPENGFGNFFYPDYSDLREQIQSCSDLVIQKGSEVILKHEPAPVMLLNYSVSRNFFTTVGIKPHLGRLFSDKDGQDLKNADMVVLSYRVWKKYFGEDPSIIGRSVVLADKPHIVLGVTPPSFYGLQHMEAPQVWSPMNERDRVVGSDRNKRPSTVFGRLQPGTTVEQAQAEFETIFRRLNLRDDVSSEPLHSVVLTFAQFRGTQLSGVGFLMFLMGTILLLACANISSLLLARTEQRAKEMALRAALGGSRWRLVRQLLTESLLVSLIALAVSLPLTNWITMALWQSVLPPTVVDQIADHTRMDGRVLIFATCISLLSIFLCGIFPALHASRTNLISLIREETAGRTRCRSFRLLVGGQTCLALFLIVQASLSARSYQAMLQADLGFERKEYLLVTVRPEEKNEVWHMRDTIQALPGVKQVAAARVLPFSPSNPGSARKLFLPDDNTAPQRGYNIRHNAVGSNYFHIFNIPILRGRSFNELDTIDNSRAMIINETMAKKFWKDKDPIGQWVYLDKSDGLVVQIVGITKDTKLSIGQKESPEPYFYLPLTQVYRPEVTLIVEPADKAVALAAPIRAVLKSLNQEPLQSEMLTMKEHIRYSQSGNELSCKILALFGLVGLGLASVGLHGLLSFLVNRQRHDIGIRMALGAKQHEILFLYLKRGLTPVVIGGAVGLSIALALAQLERSQFFGISPMDPVSILISISILMLVALIACWLPICRAIKTDPMEAIRHE